LIQNVEGVDRKIDSIEERLARLNDENKFAQSLLDDLINDSGEVSTIDNSFNQGKFYCNFCDISFPNGFILCAHMMDRHVTSTKKLFFCCMCKASFSEPRELQEHINGHCQSGFCSLCSSSTDSKEVHPIEEVARLKLVCDFCSHIDTSISSLQIHCLLCTNNPSNENYHQTDEGRVCHKCLQVFNSNAYMLKHVSQKHSGPETTNQEELIKKFACEECGRRFISNTSLAGHKKVHTKKPGILTKFVAVRPGDRFNNGQNATSKRKSAKKDVEVQKPIRPRVISETNGSVSVEDMPEF
jgi:hypothetical protein